MTDYTPTEWSGVGDLHQRIDALQAENARLTQITEGRLVDAILSVTNHWPEPLTPEEAVGIAVAVKTALSHPEEES